MKIEDTFISGLKLIHLKEFMDPRGSFIKVFSHDFFSENNLKTNFKESYYSVSKKNVIRGMHFQIPPNDHTKVVYLNHGRILDVVLDIRKDSATFGQFHSIELNTKQSTLLYIPVGCAHGFLSLEDHSMVTYLQTSCYHQKHDTGILYNSFGLNWNIDCPIISERDNSFLPFNKFSSPF